MPGHGLGQRSRFGLGGEEHNGYSFAYSTRRLPDCVSRREQYPIVAHLGQRQSD